MRIVKSYLLAELGTFEGLQVPLLLIFLALVFVMGGSSRGDVQSLVLLRPLSVIFCGFALWSLRMHHVRANAFLFALIGALFALGFAHLIPLPPQFWAMLPGRALLFNIDNVTGLGSVWRPISMVPSATWNAVYSLFAPLAVMMLYVQVKRSDHFRLLPVILIFGFASGLLGLLQTVGSPGNALHFYGDTSDSSAVGLFANRNHQALFLALMFPILAAYASMAKTEDEAKRKLILSLALSVFLVPLLLVTGSRAGLVLGMVSIIIAMLLYKPPTSLIARRRRVRTFNVWIPVTGFVVICLGAITVLTARAEALSRLIAPDQIEELRFRVWGPILKMGLNYFPAGSGVGTFVEVYQIDEPYALLAPTYLNHAHNEFVEIFLTTGLAGVILLCISLYVFVRAAFDAFRKPHADAHTAIMAKLGVVIIAVLAIGSIGDYPLRTPWLMCLLVIAGLWIGGKQQLRVNLAGTP